MRIQSIEITNYRAFLGIGHGSTSVMVEIYTDRVEISNPGERDIREYVIKRKISGSTCSGNGR